MAESLVVGSKVKEAIKVAGCNTAGDAVDALSAVVALKIKKPAERGKATGRKPVGAVAFKCFKEIFSFKPFFFNKVYV